MQLPPLLIEAIRIVTTLALLCGVGFGLGVGVLFLIRKTQPNRWANWLFSSLLGSMALTLLDKLLSFTLLKTHYPVLSFLPIYQSFAFAPFLFFYVKSRLYPHFEMSRRDFKHFILPTVQVVLLVLMLFYSSDNQLDTQLRFFSPFYGNFEKGVFIAQFLLYLYFAYRFILHERSAYQRGLKRPFFDARRQVLVLGWLKRLVKTLSILFGIHAVFILTDYFSLRLFNFNLQERTLFSAFYELSFGAMLAWLILNGLFALRRRI
jgi:hypothetical protein